MSSRPFMILGIQQIAIGGLDKARLRRLWVDTLGLAPAGNYRSERENVDEDILVLGAGPTKVEVDLMQPLDPAQRPAVHEPPLNHVGLWVDDLAAAVAWLTAQGTRFAPGGIRKGAAGHDVCFIHPKGNDEFPIGGEGVLIELVQAPPDIVAALAPEDGPRCIVSVAAAERIGGGSNEKARSSARGSCRDAADRHGAGSKSFLCGLPAPNISAPRLFPNSGCKKAARVGKAVGS